MTPGSVRRILLIQLYHLGDVLLTTPAIRAVRRRYPDARIDLLTGSLGAQAVEGNPHINHVLVQPPLRELHRLSYDAVADMHSVPRTAMATLATRARIRAGVRGRGPRNLAYTHLRDREPGAVYMALQKLRVLAPLGVEADDADLSLEISIDDEHRRFARHTLSRLDRPIIAISPVAKHEFKQWGAENWAALADVLAATGASILITSGPGEEEQARAVAQRMKHEPLWQYGPTTVRHLAAMYEQCSAWFGNDGGPKHIAVAAGTPTVTIYRRQLGKVWSNEADPTQAEVNSGTESLENVTVEEVISASRKLGDAVWQR